MHCTLFHTLFLNICTDLQIITYCYGSGLVATHVPSWGSSGTSLHLHGVLQPCASILFHTHGCYGALPAQSRCSTCSIYISLKSPNKASATDTDRSSSCVGKGESGGGKVLAGGFMTLTKKVTCSVEVTRKRKRNWSSYAYAEVSYA